MRRLPWILAVSAFAGTGACQVVENIPAVVQDTCAPCTQTNCPSQAAACEASPACNKLAVCLSGCHGDPACRSQCTMANGLDPHHDPATGAMMVLGTDVVLAGELEACIAANCDGDCRVTCGGLSTIAPPDAAAACSACLQRSNYSCACGTRSDCQEYLLCRQNCSTGDCVGECPNSPFTDFFATVRAGCANECDIGSNWACLGHVTWPPEVFQGGRTVTVQSINDLEGHHWSGVTVLMCAPGDPSCLEPVDVAETDSDGTVTFQDMTNPSLNSGLGLNGFLAFNTVSGGAAVAPETLNMYPTNVYWGFPLSNGGVVTQATSVPSIAWWNGNAVTSGLGGLCATPGGCGVIVAGAVDCFGSAALGITFSLSPSPTSNPPTVLYLSSISPLTIAGGTPGPNTIAAIFPNVAPGLVDVVAVPPGSDRPSGRVSVNVQTQALTQVFVSPEPEQFAIGSGQ
jgi:hypothetical protein